MIYRWGIVSSGSKSAMGAERTYPRYMESVIRTYALSRRLDIRHITLEEATAHASFFHHLHFVQPYDYRHSNVKKLETSFSSFSSYSLSVQDEYFLTEKFYEAYRITVNQPGLKFVVCTNRELHERAEKIAPSSAPACIAQFYDPALFNFKPVKGKTFKLVHCGRVVARKKIDVLLDIGRSTVVPIEIWGPRVPGIHNKTLDNDLLFRRVYQGEYLSLEGDHYPAAHAQYSWGALLLNRGYNVTLCPRVEYSAVESMQVGTVPILLKESLPAWMVTPISLSYVHDIGIGTSPAYRGEAFMTAIQSLRTEKDRLATARSMLARVEAESKNYNATFKFMIERVLL